MKKITITVEVPLRVALDAGRATFGEAEVTLSDAGVAALSDDARRALAARPYSSGYLLRADRWNISGVSHALEVTSIDEVTVVAALNAWATADAAARAEHERERAAAREAEVLGLLAEPASDWIVFGGDRYDRLQAPRLRGGVESHGDPRIAARCAAIRDLELAAEISAWRSRRDREDAERERERLAKEQAERDRRELEPRRLRRLAERVRRAAVGHVIERLDLATEDNPLGALPESEAVAIVRDAELPADWYGKLRPYARIGQRDVCESCDDNSVDCCDSPFHFSSSVVPDIGPWTPAQWEGLKRVRACFVEHSVTLEVVEHKGYCEQPCETGALYRYGVRVTKDLGDGLVVTREYGVPDSDERAG